MCSNGDGARPQNVSRAPGEKEGTEFRSNLTHPLPLPHPPGLECPSPTKLWGFVALKLSAVNVVTF